MNNSKDFTDKNEERQIVDVDGQGQSNQPVDNVEPSQLVDVNGQEQASQPADDIKLPTQGIDSDEQGQANQTVDSDEQNQTNGQPQASDDSGQHPAVDKDEPSQAVDNNEKNNGAGKKEAPVNLGRRQVQCSICQSEVCQQLEDLFVDWMSPDVIVTKFSNITRDSIYRHAHALDLFSKRERNIKMALGKMIQRVDTTELNGSTILSAIKLLAKMVGEKQ